jgi:hypothetical protein
VDLLSLQGGIALTISLVLLVVKAFALLDALRRPAEAYIAADKQSKNMWLVLLGLALVAHVLLGGALGLLNLAGTVAALVYLADARPALRAVMPGR